MSTVTEWLELTAERYPDKPALVDETQSLTFAEYRRYALAVARYLIDKKIRDVPVAVYLEKSVWIPVVFFGIAYSGNCYSPIDTELPDARIRKMMETLQPALVITRKSLSETFSASGYLGEYLFLEDLVCRTDDASAVLPLQETFGGEHLLYILFTSGSTGVPKGVAITHRSVINYISWACDTFAFTSDDSFGNQAPFCFDNSILDIYCSVRSGAVLYLIPPVLFAQPVPLLQYLHDRNISTIFWVPSALLGPAKLKAFSVADVSQTLRRVLFCGEVMSTRQLNVWRSYLPDVMYANLYGPTEITDACTCYIVDRRFADTEPLPIGRPISNVRILLLSPDGTETPYGEIGEIGVMGVCLSPGYYRNPEKTREVFLPAPGNPQERIYMTGDLARYNDYGELVYVSRKDYQIKHLGRRVELGELETVADSFSSVAKSCAVYDERRHKILLAVEPEPWVFPDTGEIAERLTLNLPRYMTPNKIIIIDKMPINSNGKINRIAVKELLT